MRQFERDVWLVNALNVENPLLEIAYLQDTVLEFLCVCCRQSYFSASKVKDRLQVKIKDKVLLLSCPYLQCLRLWITLVRFLSSRTNLILSEALKYLQKKCFLCPTEPHWTLAEIFIYQNKAWKHFISAWHLKAWMSQGLLKFKWMSQMNISLFSKC